MQNGPLKNVADVSAPATKTDTPLLETSQAVSAVTRDQIEQQTASSIKQALLYTSGVAVDTRGAYSDFDVILARHQPRRTLWPRAPRGAARAGVDVGTTSGAANAMHWPP